MARLAVVIGDPTGIGPEVLAKALASRVGVKTRDHDDLLLVGDVTVWRDAVERTGIRLPVVRSEQPGRTTSKGVPFLDVRADDRKWRLGEMSPAAGRATAAWMARGVRLAMDRVVDGLVFAPLNKQAIIDGGQSVRDEYELCAKLAGIEDYDEVNVIPHPAAPESGRLLWVARATGHMPLREVPAQLTRERLIKTIRLVHRVALQAGATEKPRIGLAALNPHAGEGGLLGDEEERILAPVVVAAITEGMSVMGPIPADHIFRHARAGRFDVIVALYHDQAQIATKLLGFEMGVSVGIGYPFVMVTPSHGTAFDIAGKGVADHRPMAQALSIAARLSSGRQR